MYYKHPTRNILNIFLCCLLLTACARVDVFEKNTSIPGHEWKSNFKPEISFTVTDTLARYNIYVVVRHSDAYRYNNIWLNVYTLQPRDTLNKQRLDLRLATDSDGWLASGMDDIFEHRIRITHTPIKLARSGTYLFRLENIMREDPLQHVLNVGIRIEKSLE